MYKFIDTVETPSLETTLGTEAVNVNGVWLEELIPEYKTLNVAGREALEVEIADNMIDGRDGSIYRASSIKPRTLVITYQIACKGDQKSVDFRNVYNTLLSFLANKELTLIFNDELKYKWKGRLVNVAQPAVGRDVVLGSFSVYCLDPYKHAVEPYEIDILGTRFTRSETSEVTDGDTVYTLNESYVGFKRIASDMAGSYPVLNMKIRSKGSRISCSYLADPALAIFSQDKIPAEWQQAFTHQNLEYWLINRSASLAEGSTGEVPAQVKAQLEELFTIGGDAISEIVTVFNVTDMANVTDENGWRLNDGIFNFNLNGYWQQGATRASANNRLYATSWGTRQSGWYGPSRSFVVPDPKVSGTFSFKTEYASTANNQTGAIRFAIAGTIGGKRAYIADLSFFKTSTTSQIGGYRMMVNGKTAQEGNIDVSINNIFGAFTGCENSITKKGSTITFSFGGQSYTFEDEELADVAIKEAGVWFNRTGRYLNPDQSMGHNNAYDLKLTVTDDTSGNAFEFAEGDEVMLDFGTGDLVINGNLRNDLIIDMADWADTAKVSTLFITPVGGGIVEHTENVDGNAPEIAAFTFEEMTEDLEGIDQNEIISTDCLMDFANISFDEARL